MKKTIIHIMAFVLIGAISFVGGMMLTKKTFTNEEVSTFELKTYNEQIEKFPSEHSGEFPLFDSHTVKTLAEYDFFFRLGVEKTKNLKVSYDDKNDAWYVCAEVRNNRSYQKAHILYHAEDTRILAVWVE